MVEEKDWERTGPYDPSGPRDPDQFQRAVESSGQVHETEQLHRLLVESVRDYAIFALDPTGHVLTWNPGAQRFKGWTADEIIGRHFSLFYPPVDVANGKPARLLRQAERNGSAERGLARAQGRHSFLGRRRHHSAARRVRQTPGLREGNA